jgi:hypothetical protein
MLQASGSTLGSAMTGIFLLVMVGWASVVQPNDPVLARLHRSLSVNLDLMIVQDAFRSGLALLQRLVPFDVAGVRQLLAAAIR